MAAAKASVAENAKWYSNILDELRNKRREGTSPKKLEDYIGTYWDAIHVMKIEVSFEDGTLYWALQGLPSEKFSLDHYEHDTFTSLRPRNELAKRGRWVNQGAEFSKRTMMVRLRRSSGSMTLGFRLLSTRKL